MAGVVHHNTGKTLMGMCTAHVHARGRPYRGIVVCPGHLTDKWAREIEETIPWAKVVVLRDWRDVLNMVPATVPFAFNQWGKPDQPEWYVIGRDRAKLGCGWEPRVVTKTRVHKPDPAAKLQVDADDTFELASGRVVATHQVSTCPRCGKVVTNKEGVPLPREKLPKNRRSLKCDGKIEVLTGKGDDAPAMVEVECGEPLYQSIGKPWRWAPERVINKKLSKFFDYFILDEMHEAKGEDTAQATSVGAIAAASKNTIAMTGTLIGGYAHHIFSLMYRLAPRTLVEEGFHWGGGLEFSKAYGRVDTIISHTVDEARSKGNSNSRGSSDKAVQKIAPGIMPTLYGRHIMGNTLFLGLSQLAKNLPKLDERVIACEVDQETREAYDEVRDALQDVMADMLVKGDTSLLGAFLESMLYYPDHPYGWNMIGYQDKELDLWIPVVKPAKLDSSIIRPKEQALIDLCLEEQELGNQVWIYIQRTGERDMLARLEKILGDVGIEVRPLRSKVSPDKRERWIIKQGPGVFVSSHPQLVETGLDLFSKQKGGHNYSTLVFYQTGYRTFTLRQAGRRAWRIGQRKLCKVRYLYYENTMQANALALMGDKVKASLALEGDFSEEGLVAMASDSGEAMALAKSLGHALPDVAATWNMVDSQVHDTELEVLDETEGGSIERELVARFMTAGQYRRPRPVSNQLSSSAADRLRRLRASLGD